MGKEGAGAAATDGDFVADQVHLETITQGAGQSQVFRVVHRHARSPLYQGFDNEGGDLPGMPAHLPHQFLQGADAAVPAADAGPFAISAFTVPAGRAGVASGGTLTTPAVRPTGN